jgi:purine-nucleoside phosphorylase
MSTIERMDRLVCRRCSADVQNIIRCGTCGAMHPTSELRAALLSPSAFGFYGLILLLFVLLSNW